MATADQQGIMALPQDAAGQQPSAPPAQPQMGLEESYDAIQQGLTNASPQASQQLNQMLAEITPQLDQLEDEQLNMLLQLVQYLNDHPEEYSQRVKELVDQDIIDEGDFPPDFDPEFLSALGTILLHALRSRQGGAQAAPEMTPPATMARGGIAEAARQVAGRGRGQDTMLAHITPREAAILRSHGGMGTINPQTGLPEYGLFDFIGKALKGVGNAVKSVVKGVGNAVKTILKSPIGKILGTVALATFLGPGAFGITGLGLGTAASMGLASAGTTLLAGGSLKQALISGATAYFGAPGGAVSNFVGQAGITNMAANAAASAGIVGVGAGLLSGQKLADAVKTGLTAGAVSGLATGVTQGFGTSIPKVEAPTVPTDLSAAGNAPTQVGGPNPAGNVQGTELPPVGAPAPAASVDGPMGPPAPAGMGENFMGPPAPPVDSSGIGSVWNKTKELYNEYLSPSEIQKRGIADAKTEALKSYNTDIANGVPKEIAAASYTEAIKAGTPGMFATYAPLVGAGLGVTALMGGFKQSKPQETEVQKSLRDPNYGTRLIEQDPAKYLTQNLPGLTYDSRGAIIKSSPWSPQTAGPISVEAKEYVPYTPSPYITPSGAIGGGGRTIAQPYNTSSMYDFMPRYAAEGGIMEVEPVHMARGGRISPALGAAIVQEARKQAAASGGLPPALPQQGTQVISSPYAAVAYRPEMPAPAPAPSPAPVAAPIAAAPAQQPYIPQQTVPAQQYGSNPAQVSELARRMYPSLYDEEYKKMIMGNMSGGAGIASLAKGGYPRRTGQISGPGTGTSDSIPAMLSDGEFVMTAKAVRGAGKGSRLAGAKKMYALMHQLERNAARG